ncbi:unnamed protein product, partial [Laminaria digitata]
QVIKQQREHGRCLLQEDILRQRETDVATRIQGAWKMRKMRRRLQRLKWATGLVQRKFRRLEAKRAAEKAERMELDGPEVLTVYQQGTVVSGVPLMLSVLRCGFSFKFVGRDQEACWAHRGYCYEFEASEKILRKHNERYADGHAGGGFLAGPVRPVIAAKRSKEVEMLVSRLALVDALMAPTTELRAQHKYKILAVQTADL